MTRLKPITIVGGGLAGLTLGIGLRRRGIPVTVWEAGKYPRHRVCGEFISGNGWRVLEKLELSGELSEAGAHKATTAAFFAKRKAESHTQLPNPAICVSRFVLDELLARRFEEAGGELGAGMRWQGAAGEGIVLASGRRAQAMVDDWRWFGLKAHARGVRLRADLEMHLHPRGYVGLCQLANNKINVCGLFRRRSPMPDLARTWTEFIRGTPDSQLHARLRDAEFITDSFCAVSGLSLKGRCARDSAECRVGDALTMIPPVTGNGMSMAFESAELAMEPLTAYSRGEFTWLRAQEHIARSCDAVFRQRLLWAALLHAGIFEPLLASMLVLASARCPSMIQVLFGKTR